MLDKILKLIKLSLSVVALCVLCGQALAQAPNLRSAKRKFAVGVAAFQAGRLDDALAAFETSYRLNPIPEVLNNIGLVQHALHHDQLALDSFIQYLEEAPADLPAPRRRIVEQLIAECSHPSVIPIRVEVQSAPPPVENQPIVTPLPTPSPQTIPFATELQLDTLAPRAPALGTVAGSALVATAGVGGIALRDHASYVQSCRIRCDQSLYGSGAPLARNTDVLLGGGVTAAVATSMVLLIRPRHHPLAFSPMIGGGGGSLVLKGTF